MDLQRERLILGEARPLSGKTHKCISWQQIVAINTIDSVCVITNMKSTIIGCIKHLNWSGSVYINSFKASCTASCGIYLKEIFWICVSLKYTSCRGLTQSPVWNPIFCVLKRRVLTVDGSFVLHYPHWVGQLHFAARTFYLCYTAPFGTLKCFMQLLRVQKQWFSKGWCPSGGLLLNTYCRLGMKNMIPMICFVKLGGWEWSILDDH